jgi:hypothetical protein
MASRRTFTRLAILSRYRTERFTMKGAVGSKPAKVMAVYIVEKGKPLVQPAQ